MTKLRLVVLQGKNTGSGLIRDQSQGPQSRTTMSEYIGLDVSKEETSYCIMDREGKILARGKIDSDPEKQIDG